jgi:hypothetical protein
MESLADPNMQSIPEPSLSIITRSETGLTTSQPPSGRIVAEMVDGALGLSRAAMKSSADLVPRFKIGDHLFCEPDYQQIMIWAQSLHFEPHKVVEYLLKPRIWWAGAPGQTHIENGRILSLLLDGNLLPLKSFNWVDGLVVEAFALTGSPSSRKDAGRLLPIKLPQLRRLLCDSVKSVILDLGGKPFLSEIICYSCELTEIDLTKVPALTKLVCCNNQLAGLNFSKTPLLTELDCGRNQIAELDLSRVPRLSKLCCADNQLTDLDLSHLPSLVELDCENDQSAEIEYQLGERADDERGHNQISALDLSSVPQLSKLKCAGNDLDALDLSRVPLLTAIGLYQ